MNPLPKIVTETDSVRIKVTQVVAGRNNPNNTIVDSTTVGPQGPIGPVGPAGLAGQVGDDWLDFNLLFENALI